MSSSAEEASPADTDGGAVISSSSVERTTPESGEDAVNYTITSSAVVVKLTAQYHPEAHHRLAAEEFVLVLHACVPVVPVCGGLFMVAMDRVHEKVAWDLVQ